jgi:hypothetical protein
MTLPPLLTAVVEALRSAAATEEINAAAVKAVGNLGIPHRAAAAGHASTLTGRCAIGPTASGRRRDETRDETPAAGLSRDETYDEIDRATSSAMARMRRMVRSARSANVGAISRASASEARQRKLPSPSGESSEGTNVESGRAILRYFRPFGLASRETLEGGTITAIHAMRSEHAGQRHGWLRDH